MEKEFVPYELALELKQLGFDESCFGWFRNTEFTRSFNDLYPKEKGEEIEIIKASTFSQAFRWFREKHNLEGIAQRHEDGKVYKYHIYLYSEKTKSLVSAAYGYISHEGAAFACLTKLIELVKTA